jgi:C-terminal processing protease CtpA/Prc
MRRSLVVGLMFSGVLLGWSGPLRAQGASGADQYKIAKMLSDAYDAVRHYYYDPTFHGVDLDARYREYTEKVKTTASLNAGLALVADFLNGLHDSHTYFSPPARPYKIDYGYRVMAIGDQTFVTRVRPETDASGKVKAGDQLVALNGRPLTRENLASAEYTFNILEPQPSTRLTLRSPTGTDREVVVQTKVVPGRQFRDLSLFGADPAGELSDLIKEQEAQDFIYRQQVAELGDVMIWKMPTFVIENSEIDKIFSIARRHQALILDLRGNPGGLIDAMRRVVGNLIDHDVTIAEEVMRKDRTKLVAKTRGNVFTGKVVVLVDSASASSAELLARVIQLEHRGVVVGDRSAGDVMVTQFHAYDQGGTIVILYNFAVTAANLIMGDGKSLEGVGVTPDTLALPTAMDLAAGRDPVLAQAAASVGLSLTPVAAGLLFPFEWTPF